MDRNMENNLAQLKKSRRPGQLRLLFAIILVIVAVIWSWAGTGFSIPAIMRGVSRIYNFIIDDLIPPRFDSWQKFLNPTLQTLYMAYVGAIFAIILSLGLGIISANNLISNRLIVYLGRGISSFLRAVPAVAWAVILVAAVGLGPFAGTIAIALGGAGMLGKTYADSLEEIDMGQVEALKAVGASWFQVLTQAVLPQFLPDFFTWSFYRFDLNIRSAAVVGLVGAGGLGFSLDTAIRLFQFREATMGILWIFGLILIVEFITAKSRDKILEGL